MHADQRLRFVQIVNLRSKWNCQSRSSSWRFTWDALGIWTTRDLYRFPSGDHQTSRIYFRKIQAREKFSILNWITHSKLTQKLTHLCLFCLQQKITFLSWVIMAIRSSFQLHNSHLYNFSFIQRNEANEKIVKFNLIKFALDVSLMSEDWILLRSINNKLGSHWK